MSAPDTLAERLTAILEDFYAFTHPTFF